MSSRQGPLNQLATLRGPKQLSLRLSPRSRSYDAVSVAYSALYRGDAQRSEPHRQHVLGGGVPAGAGEPRGRALQVHPEWNPG